jgi:hypothetical protein
MSYSPPYSRLYFGVRLAIAAGALVVGFAAGPASFFAAQRPMQSTPQPVASPNAPNPSYPQGMNGPGAKEPDAKTLDKQNQLEVRAEVDKLYALIFELRETMKQTDSNSTLSVTVVKKAQQIEKLAKEIKDRAKN